MSSSSAVQDTASIILGADPSLYQVEYTPLPSVERFHALPRFSRSDDFSLLFSDNPDEVRHYSLGLMFLAVLIICCFVTWAFALLILKCIGPKHVGVLSGYPYQKEGCKATAGRSTLATSSLLIIILAIVMVTKGLADLQYTADTIDMTNQDAIQIHDELQALTTNLKDVARRATPVRDQLVSILQQQDICPLQPGTTTESTVRSIGNETLQTLLQLDDFLASQLNNVVDVALAQVHHATIQVDTAVQQTQFNGPIVTAIMFPFFVVPAFVLVAVFMGWFDVFCSERYYTFMTWCIMPLMAILTALALVAAGWVLVTLQGNSDFCYAPEQNVQQIFARYYYNDNDYNNNNNNNDGGLLQPGQLLYYDVAMFYSQQCRVSSSSSSNPWTFLEVYHDQLQQAQSSLDSFLTLVLQQSPEQLSQECGLEYSPVMELLNTLKVHSTILLNTTTRSLKLLSCESIVPLYINSVYNGMCSYSIVAAKYCFSCLLLMAFFGMLCVMFRGSYFPIDYFYFEDAEGDQEKDDSLYSTSDDDYDDDDDEVVEDHHGGSSPDDAGQRLDVSMMETLDESALGVERYGGTAANVE